MLNVLYISNQGGGAPKSLLNMIKSLRGQVYPIVLFENDWYDYQAFVKEGIECLIVPYRMNMVLSDSSYKTVKWKIHRLMDEYSKNKLAAKRIKKQLKGREIDIVHTNTGAITIGVEVAKKLHAKHVWHLREFQDIDFGGHPYCGWDKFHTLIDQSDAVIAITNAVYNHFHLENHSLAKVIYDAVRKKSDTIIIKEKQKYVLYCSSMIVPEKGLHDLIEAYANSSLPQKGIKLRVLGIMSSTYQKTIEEYLVNYQLKDYVIFEGNQSNTKPFFSNALLFILPSLNEGLGRVVIESMFYGCPVVVRQAGGPLEYIKDGVNGYFFSTTRQLSNLLNMCVQDNQLEIIKNAQKFAIENFSEEAYAPKIMSIYNQVLVKRGDEKQS